jgi:hypothetical protein
LIYINEGNPDTVQNGLINFNKQDLVYNVISSILLYQQETFSLKSAEPFRSLFLDLPVLDEQSLYELSLKREPRKASADSIE